MSKQPIQATLAVLGGDKRQISMIRELIGYSYQLRLWGVEGMDSFEDTECADWHDALAGADAVVLPLPATLDGVRIYAPGVPECERVRLDVLFREMEGMLLLGGRLSEELKRYAAVYAIECVDYFDFEPLQLKNALATAEGAISIAMKELSVTIADTPMAVIGYGRIGEVLAERLHGLRADVTVFARREEVLTRAELVGLRTVRLTEDALLHIDPRFRVIFNTVPERLFCERVTQVIDKDCLFIDLASAPGGIDHNCAQKLPFRVIWATALPGKYAPMSAGKYIAQAIKSIWENRSASQ